MTVVRFNVKRIRNTSAMVKRKISDIRKRDADKSESDGCCKKHIFTHGDLAELRKKLLKWYDHNKRDMPWRIKGQEGDINQRSYAVWVSEIMLQQTQVATVISYYNKWMKKWPKLEELSKATLEEVNEMWSGLGYYSRGRRLHEGACKVVHELQGQMPQSAAELLKQLPGVGRYTAGAIASIAQGEVTGVVDGNVNRVFSRMRTVGADITSQVVTEHMWLLANDSVDPDRPGDFNQALMELGATVCTPKTPSCSTCPVADLCQANKQVERYKTGNAARLMGSNNNNTDVPDIKDGVVQGCKLCLPEDATFDPSQGVQNYPRKAAKKAPREETTAVCILCRGRTGSMNTEYFMVQRPDKGLLAGLWEFPCVDSSPENTQKQHLNTIVEGLLSKYSVQAEDVKCLGEVVHIFSHIHQTYVVHTATLDAGEPEVKDSQGRWLTQEEFSSSAVSTAMKKIFKLLDKDQKGKNSKNTSTKQANTNKSSGDKKKQLGLEAFFKPKTTKTGS